MQDYQLIIHLVSFLLKIVNRNKVTAMKIWTNQDSFTQYNYLLLSFSWQFFHLLHQCTRWSKLSLKIKCVLIGGSSIYRNPEKASSNMVTTRGAPEPNLKVPAGTGTGRNFLKFPPELTGRNRNSEQYSTAGHILANNGSNLEIIFKLLIDETF